MEPSQIPLGPPILWCWNLRCSWLLHRCRSNGTCCYHVCRVGHSGRHNGLGRRSRIFGGFLPFCTGTFGNFPGAAPNPLPFLFPSVVHFWDLQHSTCKTIAGIQCNPERERKVGTEKSKLGIAPGFAILGNLVISSGLCLQSGPFLLPKVFLTLTSVRILGFCAAGFQILHSGCPNTPLLLLSFAIDEALQKKCAP